ncbi:hypothetical protein ES702_02616 [subsurface metagenome]
MPQTKFFCKECGIITKTKEHKVIGIYESKYIVKIKRAYIREFIATKTDKKSKDGKFLIKDKFKAKWIPIGLYCPRCGKFIPDKEVNLRPTLTSIYDDYKERIEKKELVPI